MATVLVNVLHTKCYILYKISLYEKNYLIHNDCGNNDAVRYPVLRKR